MSMILVVDDSVVIRDTLVRLLKREGYEAMGAENGRDALHVLESKTPDLILLDVMMPDIDGLALLEMLHTNPQWKALPVIMMTAVSDTHTIRRSEQLGACEYLVKATFSIGEMLEHVKRYIDMSHLHPN